MTKIGGEIKTVEISGVRFDLTSNKKSFAQMFCDSIKRFTHAIKEWCYRIRNILLRWKIKRVVRKSLSLDDFAKMKINPDIKNGTIYFSGKKKHSDILIRTFPTVERLHGVEFDDKENHD